MSVERSHVVSFLTACGAGLEPHRRGAILEHLEGTEGVLRSWNAREPLVLAGLCHAVYGTDGLIDPLVPLDERHRLAEVVGDEAEQIVYFYASCDRAFVYPQFGTGETIRYRDRFTQRELEPREEELRDFVELTWANAVDVVEGSPEEDWRTELAPFFLASAPFASEAARNAMSTLLDLDLAGAAVSRG